MAHNKGLGRDFFSTFTDNTGANIAKNCGQMLRIANIEPRSGQPRKEFDTEELEALAASIKQYGVLQPIIVRELKNSPGFYEIIAGERRWRASRLAELTEIPAIVIDSDEQKTAEVSLIENLQRKDLNPIEEAFAYSDLITSFGLTQDEVAKRIGKSRSAIANMLRLLELPDEVMNMLKSGTLTAGHARALLALDDKSETVSLAQKIVERGLTVRDVEITVKRMNALSRDTTAKNDDSPKGIDQRSYYLRDLERRSSDILGKKVKINSFGRKMTLEIAFSDDEGLEDILSRLCGENFFKNV